MAKDDAAPDAAPEVDPTVEQARVMFDENPGIASVKTDQGILHRDGTLQSE